MWSDYFTCGSPSLAEQIAQDWTRPIAIQAYRRDRDIQTGLEIRGYNLAGAKITLSWPGVDEPPEDVLQVHDVTYGCQPLEVRARGLCDDQNARPSSLPIVPFSPAPHTNLPDRAKLKV